MPCNNSVFIPYKSLSPRCRQTHLHEKNRNKDVPTLEDINSVTPKGHRLTRTEKSEYKVSRIILELLHYCDVFVILNPRHEYKEDGGWTSACPVPICPILFPILFSIFLSSWSPSHPSLAPLIFFIFPTPVVLHIFSFIIFCSIYPLPIYFILVVCSISSSLF